MQLSVLKFVKVVLLSFLNTTVSLFGIYLTCMELPANTFLKLRCEDFDILILMTQLLKKGHLPSCFENSVPADPLVFVCVG